MKRRVQGAIRFLLENSLFLIIGAALALGLANYEGTAGSYKELLSIEIPGAANPYFGDHHAAHADHGAEHGEHAEHAEGEHAGEEGHAAVKESGHEHDSHGEEKPLYPVTLHWIVNDILMAFFFAIAGKEVWEALLPGGPLNNPRKAATPLMATIGGMVGPAGVYILGVALLGKTETLANGWAIPCATDIAFSYMVARLVFGDGHPAISFLLLLAIADDALGLLILAIFYPQGEPAYHFLGLAVLGILVGLILRRAKVTSFWWYLLIPGTLSWCGFALSGLHPALGLLPIIPTLPHAKHDLGIFMAEEMKRHDTLNEFEHWWKNPVEIILGLFGFMNAGVAFGSVGAATYLVLVGLLVGKPLGIFLMAYIGAKGFKFGLPEGMTHRDVVTLGMSAGIGFTVALFVSGVAFPAGMIQDAAKMGALGSFSAAILTFVLAKVLRIKKVQGEKAPAHH